MKRITPILVFFLFVQTQISIGQTIQTIPYVTLPPEQNVPRYDANGCVGNVPNVSPGTPWIVFSDRDNNNVYVNNDLSGSATKVDLGKRFLVLSQSGNNLEVIEFKRENDFEMFIAKGTCKPRVQGLLRGWMPKDKLLLSQECLKVCKIDIPNAPPGFFPLRGLFISSFGSNNFDNLYKKPGLIEPDNVKRKFDNTTFYGFVLKIVNEGQTAWYLMGKNPTVENFDKSEDIILGWKPQSEIEFWKHQLSLEINWNTVAVAEREKSNLRVKAWTLPKNGIPPPLPCDKDNYKGTTGIVLEEPVYTERASGDILDKRYPILKIEPMPNCNSDRAVIGELNFSGVNKKQVFNFPCGSFVMNQIIGDAIKCIGDFKVESQNINLVFIIDATASMLTGKKAEIFSAINTSVEKVKKSIRDGGQTAVKLRIGAVLYQDEHIAKPDRVVEYIDLSENSQDVTNWIDAHLKAENESPADYPEALFYALKKANELFSGQNRIFQSNYFIILGDHGSHQRNKDKTYVAFNELKGKVDCSLDDYIIFQHSRKSDGNPEKKNAAGLFLSQMRDLINTLGIRNSEDTLLLKSPDYQKITLKNESSFFIYPKEEGELSGQVLAFEIEKVITNTLPLLEKKIITLSNLVYSQRNNLTKSCIYDELKSFICSKPDYNKYCQCDGALQKFFRVLIQVFTGMRNSGTSVQSADSIKPFFTKHATVMENLNGMIYKPYNVVISTPKNQIERIDMFVSKILSGAGPGGTKGAIMNAWYTILINELRFVKKTGDANLIKLQDAHSLLTGYPGITRYGNLTIGDIQTGKEFTPAMVDEYVVDWIITLGYLRSVTSKKFALTGPYLTTYLGTINAVRRAHSKPPLAPKDMNALAAKFQVSDARSTPVYFQNYPNRRTDERRNIVTYYLETTVFPSQSSNFIETICNYSNTR
jgi:hypothetical protein